MRDLGAYLRAVGRDWIGKMSGAGGVFLAALAFVVPAAWQPKAFLGLGLVCLFSACYRAWLLEHRQNTDLRQQLMPRLEFTYDPGEKPYFEETPMGGNSGETLRHLRVALRNLGSTDIVNARVLLERCDPHVSPGVHFEHELQVMGKPNGMPYAHISPNGIVFFDIAREVVQRPGVFYLCYTQQGIQNDLPKIDEPYKLTLRAEGPGPTVRCTIQLGGNLRWRLEGLTLQ